MMPATARVAAVGTDLPGPLASVKTRQAVDRALWAMADRAPNPTMAAMARASVSSGGKRLRARLALAAGEALGVPSQLCWPWALACELMHNATLVHDDLQDGDELRRGEPTMWRRFGAAQAINLGDWLLMQAFLALSKEGVLGPLQRAALAEQLAAGMAQVIDGQASECGFVAGRFIDESAYLAMVRDKTAALFALPVQGIAWLAERDVESAAAAFRALGIVFQLTDDVIDLYGEKGRKAPGSDLYEGKMSALVVAHVRRHPADAHRLAQLLAAPRATTDANQVAWAMERFASGGALQDVLGQIRAAVSHAQTLCPDRLRPLHLALATEMTAPLDALVVCPPAAMPAATDTHVAEETLAP